MSNTEDAASTWQAAYDARERAVKAHPLYPTLFRKVARAEAAMRRPIRYRYRNKHFIWIDERGEMFVYDLRWGQTLTPGPSFGPYPMHDPCEFAKRLIPDVFPDVWTSEGDMIAAIYAVARHDVDARVDGRTRLRNPKPEEAP